MPMTVLSKPSIEDIHTMRMDAGKFDLVGEDSDDEAEVMRAETITEAEAEAEAKAGAGAEAKAAAGAEAEAGAEARAEMEVIPLSARILEPTPAHATALSPLAKDAPRRKSSLKGSSPPKGLLEEPKKKRSVQFETSPIQEPAKLEGADAEATDVPPSTTTTSASTQGPADTPAVATTPESAEAERKRKRREKIAAAKAKREAESGGGGMFAAAPAEVVGFADGSVSRVRTPRCSRRHQPRSHLSHPTLHTNACSRATPRAPRTRAIHALHAPCAPRATRATRAPRATRATRATRVHSRAHTPTHSRSHVLRTPLRSSVRPKSRHERRGGAAAGRRGKGPVKETPTRRKDRGGAGVSYLFFKRTLKKITCFSSVSASRTNLICQ